MRLFTVDSFTNTPFAGNPAGVCILHNPIDDTLSLKIASEINFSETAFVIREETKDTFHLRWFTPTEEVDLCGHATLATAKILYKEGYVDKGITIHFNTRSGLLTAKLVGEQIELDFPVGKVVDSKSDSIIDDFIQSKSVFVGKHGIWCLIEVEDEKSVRDIKPDFGLLLKHTQKVFIVTAKSSDSNYDFVSRCFGPAVGINEDPVTGSAHCYLADYWSSKLQKKIVKGFQVSKRTGIIECELIEADRVLLRGDAVIMSELKQDW